MLLGFILPVPAFRLRRGDHDIAFCSNSDGSFAAGALKNMKILRVSKMRSCAGGLKEQNLIPKSAADGNAGLDMQRRWS